MESSRTHFEVLGLGLEAWSPRKLACPRLEDSTIFLIVKILWSAWKIFWKTFFWGDRLKNFVKTFFFFGDCLKNFCEDLFFLVLEIAWKIFVKTFFFGEHLRLCPWSLALSIPVLGLESVCPRKGCPWPWPRIFFVSLALASSLVSSTPPLIIDIARNTKLQLYRSINEKVNPTLFTTLTTFLILFSFLMEMFTLIVFNNNNNQFDNQTYFL